MSACRVGCLADAQFRHSIRGFAIETLMSPCYNWSHPRRRFRHSLSARGGTWRKSSEGKMASTQTGNVWIFIWLLSLMTIPLIRQFLFLVAMDLLLQGILAFCAIRKSCAARQRYSCYSLSSIPFCISSSAFGLF
jgi:hypothetical protein